MAFAPKGGVLLSGLDRPVVAVGFSADSRRVIVTSTNDQPTVWDAATGQPVVGSADTITPDRTVANPVVAQLRKEAGVTSVTVSPDGRRVVTGSSDGSVKVWDTSRGQYLLTLEGHTAAVTAVRFSPDGRTLATADQAGGVRIWAASR